MIHASITQQEEVEGATPIGAFPHQKVEPQRSDIVRYRFERRLLVLIKDLHISMAAIAGLRLYRAGAAFDLLISDPLGGTALRAADAHIVPEGATKKTATIACPMCVEPADDNARDRCAAATRTYTIPDGDEPFGLELCRKAREMDLQGGTDKDMFGERL